MDDDDYVPQEPFSGRPAVRKMTEAEREQIARVRERFLSKKNDEYIPYEQLTPLQKRMQSPFPYPTKEQWEAMKKKPDS